jgi:hypothetical protein
MVKISDCMTAVMTAGAIINLKKVKKLGAGSNGAGSR